MRFRVALPAADPPDNPKEKSKQDCGNPLSGKPVRGRGCSHALIFRKFSKQVWHSRSRERRGQSCMYRIATTFGSRWAMTGWRVLHPGQKVMVDVYMGEPPIVGTIVEWALFGGAIPPCKVRFRHFECWYMGDRLMPYLQLVR